MDAYIPLTLKYRPQTLDDVVGQEAPVNMLKNAISMNRINHVYLFHGPAGTGKTSIARIWSKMLNCKSEKSPCCECSTCKSIADGKNMDVLEMNAADKRKIEDIREVLSKIRFKPMSKYKIVILDEVHMLTSEAWNALLKDLEEPPEYCIFILCTTNPEKIPVTVLSRCFEFGFTSVSQSDVVGRLEYVCDVEGFVYDGEALNLIAKKSKGGMRDALSSLDKIATFAEDEITTDKAIELLDIIDENTFENLIQNLYNHDVDNAMAIVDDLVYKNKTVDMIYYQLQDAYGSLMKNYFKHKQESNIKYGKSELLSICKLFVEYESRIKFASDKYYVLVSLLYDITNKASEDINDRLTKLEELVKNGHFKSSQVDGRQIDRIKMALNGKQERAKELKQQSESKVEPGQKEVQVATTQQEDDFLSSFLQFSGATRVGE